MPEQFGELTAWEMITPRSSESGCIRPDGACRRTGRGRRAVDDVRS